MTDEAAVAETPAVEAAEPSARETIITPEQNNDFVVPDAYKDAGWVNEVKSVDDLWKRLSDTQGLIGKKSVPNADATDEQLEEFYTQIRPESAEKYELNLPEGVEGEVNADEQAAYKDFVHKSGFSQKQAQGLFEFHTQAEMAKQEALNADFDKQLTEKHGAEGANEVIKKAHSFIATLDTDLQNSFAELPNKSLLAVADIIQANHKAHGVEDGSPGGVETGAAQTIESVRAELAALRVSPEHRDFTHPDHAKTAARVSELSNIVKKNFS